MSGGAGNWALSQVDKSVTIEVLLNRLIETLDSLDAHLMAYQAKARDALVGIEE